MGRTGVTAAVAVVAGLSCLGSPARLLAADPPRVHLIATGGTIANARAGRFTVEQLESTIPDIGNIAQISHEQFANVASGDLTLAQWLALAKRINELFSLDQTLTGIVVTSGTDTLEETAFFLHLT